MSISGDRNITCRNCGKTDVPDWDGEGHCIRCTRDRVLGEVSLCGLCHCMTHTIGGLCGKCKQPKPTISAGDEPENVRLVGSTDSNYPEKPLSSDRAYVYMGFIETYVPEDLWESADKALAEYVREAEKRAYCDVGNYALDRGDTALMDFIDSRLQEENQ